MCEVFEEDDTLAAEATSEENEDCARLESLAVAGGTNGLASLSNDKLAHVDSTVRHGKSDILLGAQSCYRHF